jgi:fructose-1,6-bisphosphatase I
MPRAKNGSEQPLSDDPTLFQHLEHYTQDDPLRSAVAAAVSAFAAASIKIWELIEQRRPAGILGDAIASVNADGDAQKDPTFAPMKSFGWH